jgi:hypothetical protein
MHLDVADPAATPLDAPGGSESFVVRFWERVFAALAWVSLFRILRTVVPRVRGSAAAEVWVMGHTVLAFGSLVAAVTWPTAAATLALAVYGMVRVFEISVYQTNVLLFDWYRARRRGDTYRVQGLLRMVILLLHNYAEIVAWFATAYVVIGARSVDIPEQRSVIGALYGSFQTMVSLGPGQIVHHDSTGMLLVWAQSLVGLLMTILVLARFISMLPSVDSLDARERRS